MYPVSPTTVYHSKVLNAIQEARRAADKAYDVAKVDERVNRAVAATNKADNVARVAVINAIQKQMHHTITGLTMMGFQYQWKHYCQIYQMIKHMLRGRLLASFQDLEHEGGNTRSQGGIKDNDSKIKIQDHWHVNDHSNEFPRTRLQASRKADLGASINLMPLSVWKELANSLLEEFTDELALITYPPDYDDNRTCDIESDLREIEFLLYQGEDSDFKDSIDQSDLANLDDLFIDPTPEMFTDEQPLDYSFPPRFDVYPDDFLKIKSDANNFDSFDSKGEKIKESELLIDQLDLPCDILLEYDSFNSQKFSRDDDFPSPDNEDKVKENSKKDKIGSKPNKNEKRGEAVKSLKQLQ
nr:MORN motif-containing protein [Tanacetum cinerariifolium]